MLSMLASVLVALGLVGGTLTPAEADHCPYTGCIKTDTDVRAPDRIKKGNRPTIKVRVRPESGNSTVRGSIRIVCTKSGNRKSSGPFGYVGNDFDPYKGPRLGQRGRWTCTAKFSSPHKFKPSQASTGIRVVR